MVESRLFQATYLHCGLMRALALKLNVKAKAALL